MDSKLSANAKAWTPNTTSGALSAAASGAASDTNHAIKNPAVKKNVTFSAQTETRLYERQSTEVTIERNIKEEIKRSHAYLLEIEEFRTVTCLCDTAIRKLWEHKTKIITDAYAECSRAKTIPQFEKEEKKAEAIRRYNEAVAKNFDQSSKQVAYAIYEQAMIEASTNYDRDTFDAEMRQSQKCSEVEELCSLGESSIGSCGHRFVLDIKKRLQVALSGYGSITEVSDALDELFPWGYSHVRSGTKAVTLHDNSVDRIVSFQTYIDRILELSFEMDPAIFGPKSKSPGAERKEIRSDLSAFSRT